MSIQFSQTLHNLNLQNDANLPEHAVRLSQLEQRESQLQTTLQAYANNQITTLIDGAPEALNTLNEIAAALDDDASLAANLNQSITDLRTDFQAADTAINAEIANQSDRSFQGDQALHARVDAEEITRANADSTLQTNIDAEETARIAAVSAEAAARTSDVATLNTSISSVRTDFTAADSQLQSNLDVEVNTRTNEVNSLAISISSVRNDFAAADTALQNSLSQNVSTLQAADQAEVQARQAEVSRLEVEIANKIDSSNGVASGVLNTEHIAVSPTSYVYIGDKWRIKAKADGSQLIFEYAVDGTGAVNPSSASWVTAIPFITSTV